MQLSLVRPAIETVRDVIAEVPDDTATIKAFKSTWRACFEAKFQPYLSGSNSSLYATLSLLHPKYHHDSWIQESDWDLLEANVESFHLQRSEDANKFDFTSNLILIRDPSEIDVTPVATVKRKKMTQDSFRSARDGTVQASVGILTLTEEVGQYKTCRAGDVGDCDQLDFWRKKLSLWPLLSTYAFCHLRFELSLMFE